MEGKKCVQSITDETKYKDNLLFSLNRFAELISTTNHEKFIKKSPIIQLKFTDNVDYENRFNLNEIVKNELSLFFSNKAYEYLENLYNKTNTL